MNPVTDEDITHQGVEDGRGLMTLLEDSGYTPARAVVALASAIAAICMRQSNNNLLDEPLGNIVAVAVRALKQDAAMNRRRYYGDGGKPS